MRIRTIVQQPRMPDRHVIEDCTKMNELRFKYAELNFNVPEFYRDEVRACHYVYEATQLL